MNISILFLNFIFIQLLYNGKAYILPKNSKLTYKYEAIVQTGSDRSNNFSSDFIIEAVIIVNVLKETCVFEFKNVNNSIFSGDYKMTDDLIISTPIESDSIYGPFMIQYNLYGEISKIKTHINDEDWSINIKKSIASLFQIDLKWKNNKNIEFYNTTENTIHGNCQVLYKIKNTEEFYNITKYFDKSSCRYTTQFNNTKTMFLDNFENNLSSLTLKNYEITNKSDELLIKRISSTNTIKFNIKNETDFITIINQKLELIGVTERKGKFHINSTETKEELIFIDKKKSVGDIYKILKRKRISNQTDDLWKKFKQVVDHLDNISDNSEELIESLFQVSKFLLKEELREFYSLLKISNNEQMIQIFLKFLPYVGTGESVSFILELISNRIVDGYLALALLSQFPFNIKYPDESLLVELNVFIRDTKLVKDIRYMASLSFAIVLSKTDTQYKLEIVQELIDDVKKCKDHNECFISICSLSNTKHPKAIEFLEKIVKNENIKHSPKLRRMTMILLKNEYIYNNKKDDTYWSILRNTTENVHIRIMALNILMTNPDLKDLKKMYDFIKNENHKKVHNYALILLKSLSKITHPRYSEISLYAETILKQLLNHPHEKHQDFHYIIDYYDSNYESGMKVKTFGLGELMKEHFFTFFAEYFSEIYSFDLDNVGLYLNIDIEEDKAHKHGSSGNLVHLIEMLINHCDNLEIDILLFKNNYVSYAMYLSPNETMQKLVDQLEFYISTDSVNYEIISSNKDALLMTDIGMPIIFNRKSTTIFKYMLKMSKNLVGINVSSNELSETQYSLQLFNPILNLWHGIVHKQTIIMNSPVELEVVMDILDLSIAIALNYDKNNKIKNVLFELNTYDYVFLLDETLKEPMKRMCNKCNANNKMTTDHLLERTLWYEENEYFNVSYGVKLNGCKNYNSLYDIMDTKSILLSENIIENVNDFYFLTPFLKIHNFIIRTYNRPNRENCRIIAYIEPHHKRAEVSINIKFPLKLHCNIYHDEVDEKLWSIQIDDIPNYLNVMIAHKNHTFCYVVNYTAGEKELIEYNLQIYSGTSENGLCLSDVPILNLSMLGNFSKEPRTPEVLQETYEECIRSYTENDLVCEIEQSVARYYKLHVDYERLPVFYKNIIKFVLDEADPIFHKYLNRSEPMNDTNSKIDVELMFSHNLNTLDVDILSLNKRNYYNDILLKDFFWTLWTVPYNPQFLLRERLLSYIFKLNVCEIKITHIKNMHNKKISNPLNEWTTSISKCMKDSFCFWSVDVKRTKKSLALRFIDSIDSKQLTLYYNNTLKAVTANTTRIIEDFEFFTENGFVINGISKKRFLITILDNDLFFEYSRDFIKIYFYTMPNDKLHYSGLCI